MAKKETIDGILLLEWNMFDAVQNEGGRAACQDDYKTFEIMRRSQFEAWEEAPAQSWLGDLVNAEADSRNLVTEKYAHMMRYTAPERYEEAVRRLPPPGEEARRLALEIGALLLAQTVEYARQYPALAGRGRPIHASENDRFFASVETYLTGELLTYSLRTLRLFSSQLSEEVKRGVSYTLRVMQNTVLRYGYASLAEADRCASVPLHPIRAGLSPDPIRGREV